MAELKARAVVAELGRPETLEETAARKAENSRKHRANQTLLNLVVALVASLAIVLFLVVVVVRPDPHNVTAVDYRSIATQAQGASPVPLIVPAMPSAWTANAASFGLKAQVSTWYIGFLTPSVQFIGLDQGIDANPTWQATILDNTKQTGTATIGGLTWAVYDNRTAARPGNFAYSIATTQGRSTIVLHGTAPTAEFEQLAAAVAAQLGD